MATMDAAEGHEELRARDAGANRGPQTAPPAPGRRDGHDRRSASPASICAARSPARAPARRALRLGLPAPRDRLGHRRRRRPAAALAPASSSGFATRSPPGLRDARAELARAPTSRRPTAGLLERMIAEPERHRWVIVSNEDIGERGCRHWHSRPRWGILGMLFGWWRVRLSSGCPLAEGLRPPRHRGHAMSSRSAVSARPRRPRRRSRATAPKAAPGEPQAAPQTARSRTSARRRPGARSRWSSSSSRSPS